MNKDLFFVHQDFQNLTSSFGNRSSGTKDSSHTGFIQEIISELKEKKIIDGSEVIPVENKNKNYKKI